MKIKKLKIYEKYENFTTRKRVNNKTLLKKYLITTYHVTFVDVIKK